METFTLTGDQEKASFKNPDSLSGSHQNKFFTDAYAALPTLSKKGRENLLNNNVLEIPPHQLMARAGNERHAHSVQNDVLPAVLLQDKNIDPDKLSSAIAEKGKLRLIIIDDWQSRKKVQGTNVEIPYSSHGDHTQWSEYESLPSEVKSHIELVTIDQGKIGMAAALAEANRLVSDKSSPAVISIANDNELDLNGINNSLSHKIGSFGQFSNAHRSEVASKLLNLHSSTYGEEMRQMQNLTTKGVPVVCALGNDGLQVTALAENAIVARGRNENPSYINTPFTDAVADGKNSSEGARSTVRSIVIGLTNKAFPPIVPNPQPAPFGSD